MKVGWPSSASELLLMQQQLGREQPPPWLPAAGDPAVAGCFVCFSVDASNCRLTPIGHAPTEAVPRAFSLDPQGNFLYVAGLESGRLASYRVNPSTGNLEPLEVYPLGKAPMWVLITEL